MKKLRVVIVTGGFDPLHEGHIEFFKEARKLGDHLVVGINSDAWLERKKGYYVQPFKTRMAIIENLRMVTMPIEFNDDDNSARDAILRVKKFWGPNFDYVFANGGDRTKENIPEMDVADVEFVFGVGGENKMNSSSWMINRVKDIWEDKYEN